MTHTVVSGTRHHFVGRYGQFLQTDPIGTKDDPNLYSYALQDPLNRADPSGEVVVEPILAWVGGDTATPDPTDVVPLKWEIYAAAVIVGAVADAVIAENATENESGAPAPAPDQQLDRPRTPPQTQTPDPNRDDKKRQQEQRDRRNQRREDRSRAENGQNRSGDGWRQQDGSRQRGPSGQRPKGPDRSNNRQRNVGVDEEHSMKPKGQRPK